MINMIKDNPNCRQGHGTVRLLGFTLLTGLVALLLIAPADTIQAQQSDTEDVPAIVIGGVGIVGGFPSGEFGDNVTNAGIGISGFMGYMIPNTPAIVGLESGYLIYGRERRSELFSQTIPDVRVGVVTNNSILSVNAFLRLQPQSGTLRPYVEGIIGFHYLFTSTTIEDLPLITGNDIASYTNLDDFAFTRGASAGLLIRLWSSSETRTIENRSLRSLSLDFRMRYQDGAEADYLKRGDIVRRLGSAELNVTKSTTDLITAYLGIAMDF